MSAQLSAFWESTLVLGQPLAPYAGLALLVLLALVALVLIFYLIYKLIRRLPISFRHVSWRLLTGLRRLGSWLSSRRAPAKDIVWANFGDGSRTCVSLQDSFPAAATRKALPWSRLIPGRPQEPLFLFFGPDDSAKSLLLDLLAPEQKKILLRRASEAPPAADVTWWHLECGWLLEISPQFASKSKTLAFASLLDTLGTMCPACPVDAILVALPADPGGAGERAEHLAGVLGNAVACVSGKFGDVLPTSVLVTGSETLAGFHDLLVLRKNINQQQCSLGITALPAESQTPDQVVDLLRESLEQQVIYAMAAQPDFGVCFQRREVFSLLDEVERIRPIVSTFVAHLSAVTHLPVLRSVCLIGTVGLQADAKPGAVFAQTHLREQLLAACTKRPASRFYLERLVEQSRDAAKISATLLAGAIILLIWGGVTWQAIDRNGEQIDFALSGIAPEIRLANPLLSTSFVEGDIGSVKNLLRATQAISDSSLVYVLAPVSWGNNLRPDALALVGSVIDRILLRPRTISLTAEIAQAESGVSTNDLSISAQRVEELPAYASLEAFLDAREVFGASMDSSERLGKNISYRDFVQFLGYKPEQLQFVGMDWNKSMPVAASDQFHSNAHKSPEYDAATRKMVEILWERVLHEAFDLHPLVKSSEQIVEGLRALAGANAFGVFEAQRLGENVRRVRQEFGHPASRRLLGSKAETLAFFARAQLRLSASSMVSTTQVAELIAAAEKRYERTRSRLIETEIEGIGPLYAIDVRDNSVSLTQDFKRFAGAYAGFIVQPFLRQADPIQNMDFVPGRYLEWPTARLDQVRQLAQTYRDYAAGSGQSFDPRIRGTLLRMAQQNLARLVESSFINAARQREYRGSRAGQGREGVEPGLANNLAARAANLAAVGKLFRQLSLEGEASDFGGAPELAAREIIQLLEQIEFSLFFDDPYQPVVAGIGHWVSNGTAGKPLGSDYSNPSERLVVLREYLRIQYLGLVIPLLDSLANVGYQNSSDEIVTRWKRLREVIDSYDKGAVGNSLFEFERYVLALSKLREADSCNTFLDERPLPMTRSDYFSQKLTQLDHVLVLNCESKYAERRRRQYESFAAWFNNTAAGHMPFTSKLATSGLAPMSVEQFQRVIIRYNAFRQQTERSGKESPAWSEDIANYLSRMDQIARQFSVKQDLGTSQNTANILKSAATADGSRPDIPVRARVTFRAARSDEVGADQIIGWSLSSAHRNYSPRGNVLFEWRVGEPIEIRLRWASESPTSPLPTTAKSANYSVNERTAIFRYTGDWALMEMLDRHLVRGSGGLLQFDVPTQGIEGRSMARAYFSFASPEENAIWMPEFPVEAPAFRNSVSERP